MRTKKNKAKKIIPTGLLEAACKAMGSWDQLNAVAVHSYLSYQLVNTVSLKKETSTGLISIFKEVDV